MLRSFWSFGWALVWLADVSALLELPLIHRYEVRVLNSVGEDLSVKCQTKGGEAVGPGTQNLKDGAQLWFTVQKKLLFQNDFYTCAAHWADRSLVFTAFNGKLLKSDNSFDVRTDGVYLRDKLVQQWSDAAKAPSGDGMNNAPLPVSALPSESLPSPVAVPPSESLSSPVSALPSESPLSPSNSPSSTAGHPKSLSLKKPTKRDLFSDMAGIIKTRIGGIANGIAAMPNSAVSFVRSSSGPDGQVHVVTSHKNTRDVSGIGIAMNDQSKDQGLSDGKTKTEKKADDKSAAEGEKKKKNKDGGSHLMSKGEFKMYKKAMKAEKKARKEEKKAEKHKAKADKHNSLSDDILHAH